MSNKKWLSGASSVLPHACFFWNDHHVMIRPSNLALLDTRKPSSINMFFCISTWWSTEVGSVILLFFLLLLFILMGRWPSYVSRVVPLQRQGVHAHRRLPPRAFQRRSKQAGGRRREASVAPHEPRSANQLQVGLQGNGRTGERRFFSDHLRRRNSRYWDFHFRTQKWQSPWSPPLICHEFGFGLWDKDGMKFILANVK